MVVKHAIVGNDENVEKEVSGPETTEKIVRDTPEVGKKAIGSTDIGKEYLDRRDSSSGQSPQDEDTKLGMGLPPDPDGHLSDEEKKRMVRLGR